MFTNDDLKRLKEYIENNPEPSEWFEAQKALLARLEAAEKLCDHDTDQCEEEGMGCYRCRLTKIWRKAAGKGE